MLDDDISALEQWTPAVQDSPITFFRPRPATAYLHHTSSGLWGQRMFSAKNPPFGAYFNYFVREYRGDEVNITVADSADLTVRKLSGPAGPGLHRVVWDLQRESSERIARPEWSDQPEFVPAGKYTVSLTYGDRKPIKQTIEVRLAPGAQSAGDWK